MYNRNYTEQDAIQRLLLFEEGLSGIIGLMKTEEKREQRNDMEFLCQSLSQDVCRKCPKYRECYGKKEKETVGEIASILEQAYECSIVDGRMASKEFRRNCVFFQPFMEEISWLYRLIYQNIYWEKRYGELKDVMCRQMDEQRLFLRECRTHLQSGMLIKGKKKLRLGNIFFRNGLRLKNGRECIDASGLLQITVIVCPIFGAKKTEVVEKCLEKYYGKSFYRNTQNSWLKPGENRLVFIEENSFHAIFGQKCCNKKGEDVCGDTFSFTDFGRKRAVMLLSDGMGTGEKAYEDSRRLIETLEDLLEAGISEEFALEMIQDALLFQERSTFSTIDVAVISLKTGILKLLKAGGMATFIRHKDSVERIAPSALPPGCRINQRFDLKYKKLYDGDMVIMVSDGMLEFENMPEIPFRMESLIEKIKTNNAQVFADKLIEAVPVLEDGYDDDRTVLVAAIWEKNRKSVG